LSIWNQQLSEKPKRNKTKQEEDRNDYCSLTSSGTGKATDTNKRTQSTTPQTARDKKRSKTREIGLRIDRKLQRRSGYGGGVRSLYAATVSRVVQRLQGNPVDPGSVGRPRLLTTLPTEEELFMDEKNPKLILMSCYLILEA